MEPINEFLGSVNVISAAMEDWLTEQLKGVVGSEVTLSQIRLMKLVAQTESLSVTDVATLLGVSNAAASKAIDRLVRRELVERVEDEADRRTTRLSVSPAGMTILKRYDTAVGRALEEVFGGFPAAELHRAAGLLDRISVDLVSRTERAEDVCLRCSVHFREKCLLRSHVGRACLFENRRK